MHYILCLFFHYETLGISSIASISYIRVVTSMVFLVILAGRSGIGKTEVGLQLVEEFKQQQQQQEPSQHCLECRISSCKTKNALSASLSRLADRLGLYLPAFENERTNDLNAIFKQFFEKVNERYADQTKLLLFDDAEPATSLLQHIDSAICDNLMKGCANPQRWKIIVTTQRGKEDSARDWLEHCRHITDDHFQPIRPFDGRQSLQYLKSLENFGEDEKMRLHEKMGGLPLALRVALIDFEERVVSRNLFNWYQFPLHHTHVGYF